MQLPKVTYCILRGCRIVMEYQNTMLCSGYSHELKPCEHIVNCDLCTGPSVLLLTTHITGYRLIVVATNENKS